MVSCYIDGDLLGGGDCNHYSLYHKSFSDWLMRSVSGDVYYVDQRMGYRRLAAVALLIGPKITPEVLLRKESESVSVIGFLFLL